MPLTKWIFLVLAGLSVKAIAQPSAVDSTTTVANARLYKPNSFLRPLLLGTNYREAWQQPVKVPVLHLSSAGFTVKDLGGGMQTKSLRLVDRDGHDWALRTVNKEITDDGLSPPLRNPTGRKFSQDFISSGHPFAAPLAGAVAHAAGVNAARPQAFYVADDPALGQYRHFFVGQLCTLEERDPGFNSTESSEEMAVKLQASKQYKVEPLVYLRARLLDMLLADWDRHAGNWRWGLRDSAGFRFFHAVPRDRDWAFYRSGGVLPWLAKVTGAMRYLTGFTEGFGNVKRLSWKAWTMDKFFAGELVAADWDKTIRDLQASLSDSAIDNAVKVLPQGIYEKEGAAFAHTLKKRRDDLHKRGMKYFRFLSEEAIVNGSDEEETFVVSSENDDVLVRVYRGSDTSKLVFERRYTPGETYAIHLNGFGGADIFSVAENTRSKIRLHLDGGEGADDYQLRGKLRTKVVDKNNPQLLTATTKASHPPDGSLSLQRQTP